MGHSFLYARQNTGLLWHTAVRPSVLEGQLLSVRTVINMLAFFKPIGVFQTD
jgi:hypothetical protein